MSKSEAEGIEQVLWPEAGQVAGAAKLAHATQLSAAFRQLLHDEGLQGQASPAALYESLYLPMAAWIADRHRGTPLLIGINGGQGSGKSTLCKILKLLLVEGFDKRVVVISIDDLYLPRYERQRLASSIHPLLATRGGPGTHDVPLAMQILTQLKQGLAQPIDIPVFDKAMDDRAEVSRWQKLQEPVDIILFEGWCVGAIAQQEQELARPVNTLEATEDHNKQWRRFVNYQLAGPYRDLFALIDILLMLKIPDMDNVFEWRLLQENKLKQSLSENPSAAKHVMTEKELKRFIMHYERITRATLKEMPDRADVVLELNRQHQVSRVHMNGV